MADGNGALGCVEIVEPRLGNCRWPGSVHFVADPDIIPRVKKNGPR